MEKRQLKARAREQEKPAAIQSGPPLESTKRTLPYSLYLGQTGRLPKYLPQRPRTSKRSLLFTISSSIKEDEPLRTEEGQRLNNGRHPLTNCTLTQLTGFKQTPSTWLRFSSLTVTILMTSSGTSPVYTQFCPIQPTPQRPRRRSQPCRLYCHSRSKAYGWSIHSLKLDVCLSISTIPTTAPGMNAVMSFLGVLPWDIEGSVWHAHLPHKTSIPSLALLAPGVGFFSTSLS